MMPRVLVTGGEGFIGTPVMAELKRRDYNPKSYGLAEGGVENYRNLRQAVDGCEFVIHLAGVLGTHELGADVQTIKNAVDINVKGTVNVLEACYRVGARYVGITMPQVFPSVYTATKVAATRLATFYHRDYNLPVSHVRAFNAFGPGQAYGPGHPQKIAPTFIIKALRNQPIPVWGDGEQGVDLVHINDLATMLVDAAAFGDDDIFDGGTGFMFTVADFAKRVIHLTNSESTIEYLPMRRGEKPTQIVAYGEGWDKLGWQPRFRDLDLDDTIRWYSDHLDEFPL
jgi:UDP-glucose 4-epimerase